MDRQELFTDDVMIMSIVDDMCLKGPLKTTQKDNLMKYTKDQLIYMASNLEMDINAKLKKEDFVENMLLGYKQPEIVAAIYMNLSDLELFLIDELIKAKGQLKGDVRYLAVRFLATSGFVHLYKHEDTFKIIMSDDVIKAFKNVDKEIYAFMRAEQQMVIKYTTAAINLYGAISKEKLMEQYKTHLLEAGKEILEDEILNALFVGQLITEPPYFYEDGCFFSHYYEEDNIEEAYESIYSSKPYYVPSLQKFLLYSQMDYVEKNHAFEALEKYLSEQVTNDVIQLENLMSAIKYNCEYGRLNDTIKELNNIGFSFESEAQVNHFMMLYQDFSNNHRMWLNHGFSPNEMRPVKTTSPKIGRNDICPCGSNKKYKKCCGSHLKLVQ